MKVLFYNSSVTEQHYYASLKEDSKGIALTQLHLINRNTNDYL